MSNKLKMSVSGVRGIVGDSLTAEVAEKFGYAFGQYLGSGSHIVMGTDTRHSRDEMKQAVVQGLSAAGCSITDIDIVTTPTVQIMIRHLQAQGGVMISASHNPIEWNGLKFISGRGMFLNESEVGEFFGIYHGLGDVPQCDTSSIKVSKIDNASEIHVDRILQHVDAKCIRNSGLRVVVDCCNGSGAVANPILFQRLGVDVTYINEKPDGNFSRTPEPLPQHLGDLGQAVVDAGANIGFAQDPDADRLAIVDENGVAIGEEYTLAFCVDHILHRSGQADALVVKNLSTSKMVDDVVALHGGNLMATKIGEIHVSEAILRHDALIGGEGNGGVIWPQVGYGRDSLIGMVIMLEKLAHSNNTVSQMVADLPRYEVVKDKKEVGNRGEVDAILEKVQQVFKGENMDMTDGVKVFFDNGWLHVRASNTEPIVRFYAEAPTIDIAEGWVSSVK